MEMPVQPASFGHDFYVTDNGIHSEIVLLKKDIPESFELPEVIRNARGDCLSIGWGDRREFVRTKPRARILAIGSLLWPSKSLVRVMLIDDLDILHVRYEKVYKFTVSEDKYLRLLEYLKRSVTVGKDKWIFYDSYENIQVYFYESDSPFHLFRTCNDWTEDALKCVYGE